MKVASYMGAALLLGAIASAQAAVVTLDFDEEPPTVGGVRSELAKPYVINAGEVTVTFQDFAWHSPFSETTLIPAFWMPPALYAPYSEGVIEFSKPVLIKSFRVWNEYQSVDPETTESVFSVTAVGPEGAATYIGEQAGLSDFWEVAWENHPTFSVFPVTRLEVSNFELSLLDDLRFEVVPEPSSVLMLGSGGMALLARRRAKR